MSRTLVIGAGPAGLAVAHGLGGGTLTIEAEDDVGGLCRSVEFAGAVFDLGGHSFHTPLPRPRALVERLMRGRWHEQRRDARVWHDGRLIPYPFQAHFRELDDPALTAACEAGLAAAPGGAADDLQDWIVGTFGAGIAGAFLLPYNRKLWARDLRGVAPGWVGERVAGAPDTGQARRPLMPASVVGYPAEGGFVEIYRALAREAGPIRLGERVTRIDPVARTATTDRGATVEWDRLVSTAALPALIAMIDGAPPELRDAVARLDAVALKLVMIAAAGPVTDEPQRVYVADPRAPPHKIAFNHTSSLALRARPVQAILGEVSYSEAKPVANDAALIAATVDWLVEARLLKRRADVVEARVIDVPRAYPVPTPGAPAIVAQARAWLESLGIHSIGRFGGWAYVNSDACIEEGLALADRLMR